MIKVCHMASSHYPEDVRIFHKECRSLVKAGYDVTLVEVGKSYEKEGVHIIGIGPQSEGRRNIMTKDARKVYELALSVDADIYHFHEPALLPFGLKLKKKGKIVIFDSHEHTAEALKEKTYIPMHNLVQKGYAIYQKHVCKQLDAVITATPNVTEFFRPFCKRATDAMNYPLLEPLIEPNGDSKTIVYAGGINEQWNIKNIVDSLALVSGVRFTLCGKNPEDDYMAKVMASEGWRQVDHREMVPHEQIPRIMSECSVGMALLTPGPNTDYERGNLANTKIFEEMMAGLPVVCTNFSRWKEFVEKEKCGICVDPQNVEQIAGAIRYLFDHPEEARQMGLNGRHLIETRFNWENEEKKLLALYRELSEQIKEK